MTLAAVLMILITATAVAAFMVLTPWIVGAGTAAGVALAWCRWLERHPD
jgi:hypothetical protein